MSKSKGLEWIKENKDIFNTEGLNNRMHNDFGLPNSTLKNEFSVTGQNMSPNWYPDVDEFVKELKK